VSLLDRAELSVFSPSDLLALHASVVDGLRSEGKIGPQEALDEPSDAVVGQTAIQRLDQRCRGEVADSLA